MICSACGQAASSHAASIFSIINERTLTRRWSHPTRTGGQKSAAPHDVDSRGVTPYAPRVRSVLSPIALHVARALRGLARARSRTFGPSPLWVGSCLALCLIGLSIAPAKADRSHTVSPGQSLSHIAKKYNVTVWSLAAANAITPTTAVRSGQVLSVPEPGVVYVNAGQTLWSVARRHECTVEALASVNGLSEGASLRPGMRLVLPGYKPTPGGKAGSKMDGREQGGRSWGTPKRAGFVQLFRIATSQDLSLSVVDRRGKVRKEASKQLSKFLKPRNSTKTKTPDGRLLKLLAQVSDHFGGRKIHIISGYRTAGGNTHHESRHVAAAAVDFRIEGVPNRVLRDYLRHFSDVGVGYYPNSTFVHFDVRPKNAYWVDLSSPGQKSAYVPREEREGFGEGRTAGLAELGKSLEKTFEDFDPHGEPDQKLSDDQ